MEQIKDAIKYVLKEHMGTARNFNAPIAQALVQDVQVLVQINVLLVFNQLQLNTYLVQLVSTLAL